jgi:hypothetical protein
LQEDASGPSLWPSVGNWQKPCRSHYVIRRGQVIWSTDWSEAQVKAGRQREQERREEYFTDMYRERGGLLIQVWAWMKSLFGR